MTQPTIETRSFQAETRKLLDLMIHSIYQQKDVFLRELISNSSDAIDKVRFEALTNAEWATDGKIRIIPDKQAGTLTIADNGIGMTRDEVVEHIGTIAKSGSEAYAQKLKELSQETAAPDLIGQFGVGFYSAFMLLRVSSTILVSVLPPATTLPSASFSTSYFSVSITMG